jgi:hypothetical protein
MALQRAMAGKTTMMMDSAFSLLKSTILAANCGLRGVGLYTVLKVPGFAFRKTKDEYLGISRVEIDESLPTYIWLPPSVSAAV